MSRFLLPVSLLAVSAIVLAGCSSGTPEAAVQDRSATKILTGESFLTGLGLQSQDTNAENIDNTPRGALVIPPSRDLPPPDGGTANTRPADWPADREVAARDRLREQRSADRSEWDKPLAADERRQPNVPTSRTRLGPSYNTESDRQGGWVSPSKIRRESAMAQELQSRQTAAEQPRRSLIAPPDGYATAPDGTVVEEEKPRRRWWPF